MALTTGTRVGPYEILSALGAGGMGEVYRARDTRLDRTVAVKVLPAHVASDPDLRQRFEREARAVAAMNHPHICTLHDVGSQDGVDYLVMEYLEGQTLAEQLEKGTLPFDQAMRLAIEIASALDTAHRAGITHRDLKPGNIMITKSGAKLLDFGLAKTGAPAVTGAGLSMLPTTPPNLTAQGTILGTFQYMAPEQLEGQEADARTDIFAFGAVVYEMLTGKKAFEGKSQASLIGAILKDQPPPLSTVQPAAPAALDRVVRTCLAKNPEDRWQSAADLTRELRWIGEAGSQVGVSAPIVAGRGKRAQIITAASVMIAAIVGSLATWRLIRLDAAPPSSVVRATITLPANAAFVPSGRFTPANIAVSPDGTRVAYAGTAGDNSKLYLRLLDRLEIAPVAGTEHALNPFFSPDGEWIGFFADGKLKKVRVGGGSPVALCDTTTLFGAAWGDDGTIVFAGSLSGGLSRVAANGGQPQALTKVDKGELAHRWPAFVPGSREILFAVGSDAASWGDARIAIQSLDSNEHRILLDSGTAPSFAPTDQIVFARAGSLFGVRLDSARGAAVGSPVPVVQGVMMDTLSGRAQYALSTNGTLVYVPGGEENVQRSLIWVDRRGSAQPLSVAPRGFERPRISPDGQQVALTIREGDADVWVFALERGTLTRLTHEIGEDESPVWNPDGRRVTYSSTRGQSRVTLSKAADGSGAEEQLFVTPRHQHLDGWTPDGHALLTEEITGVESDLFAADIGDKTITKAYLRTPFNKRGARLSPDGHWMAYASDESGRNEVYVQAFPQLSEKWTISTDGGIEPVWARSGRELFYRKGDKMMAVDVRMAPAFAANSPHALFDDQYARLVWGEADYDVSPDGQRFLMITGEPQPLLNELQLVVNWLAELKRRVPAPR
jgi:Tol biopolymer transport system component/predicted Ser/Thr protein kinase